MNEIFNDELKKKLRGRFMEMGINTSEQIYKATKAFIDRDVALAKEVSENDRLINDGETYLEKHAFKLMNIQRPKESEFRSIMSILKASSDLERMADHASHIARDAIRIKDMDQHWPDIENDIAQMAETVRHMLEKALDAMSTLMNRRLILLPTWIWKLINNTCRSMKKSSTHARPS